MWKSLICSKDANLQAAVLAKIHICNKYITIFLTWSEEQTVSRARLGLLPNFYMDWKFLFVLFKIRYCFPQNHLFIFLYVLKRCFPQMTYPQAWWTIAFVTRAVFIFQELLYLKQFSKMTIQKLEINLKWLKGKIQTA